eukprot:1155559-Pelagomonas_calceolata.AAC.1
MMKAHTDAHSTTPTVMRPAVGPSNCRCGGALPPAIGLEPTGFCKIIFPGPSVAATAAFT